MNLPEKFGENVFNDAVQKERLPKEVYKSLRATIEAGTSARRIDSRRSRRSHEGLGRIQGRKRTTRTGSSPLRASLPKSMTALSSLRVTG